MLDVKIEATIQRTGPPQPVTINLLLLKIAKINGRSRDRFDIGFLFFSLLGWIRRGHHPIYLINPLR